MLITVFVINYTSGTQWKFAFALNKESARNPRNASNDALAAVVYKFHTMLSVRYTLPAGARQEALALHTELCQF